MDADTGNWEDQSEEDREFIEDNVNPLAVLAAELVICSDSIEQHVGAFCTSCTCQLGYHVSCDDGACELCGCDEIHWPCESCGQNRPIEKYKAGSKICEYCQVSPPIRIKPLPKSTIHKFTDAGDAQFDSRYILRSGRSRDKAAREALKELTE